MRALGKRELDQLIHTLDTIRAANAERGAAAHNR